MIGDAQNLFTMSQARTTDAPKLTQPVTYAEDRDAGNPEEIIRDRILDVHEYSSGQILAELRAAMRRLYVKRMSLQGRDLAFVTADDARVILDTDERYANIGNKNFMGSLFREKGWEKTGRIIKSKTPGSHANELKCWRWVDPASRMNIEANDA